MPIIKRGRQPTYKVTLRHVRATIVAVEKQYVIYSESESSIKYARAMLSPVAYPAIRDFFHIISKTAQCSKKNAIEHKMRVFIFSETFV